MTAPPSSLMLCPVSHKQIRGFYNADCSFQGRRSPVGASREQQETYFSGDKEGKSEILLETNTTRNVNAVLWGCLNCWMSHSVGCPVQCTGCRCVCVCVRDYEERDRFHMLSKATTPLLQSQHKRQIIFKDAKCVNCGSNYSLRKFYDAPSRRGIVRNYNSAHQGQEQQLKARCF